MRKIKLKSPFLTSLTSCLCELNLNESISESTPAIKEANGVYSSIIVPEPTYSNSVLSPQIEEEELVATTSASELETLRVQAKDLLKTAILSDPELKGALVDLNNVREELVVRNEWEVNNEANTAVLPSRNARLFRQNSRICLSYNNTIEIFDTVSELHSFLKRNDMPLPKNVQLRESSDFAQRVRECFGAGGVVSSAFGPAVNTLAYGEPKPKKEAEAKQSMRGEYPNTPATTPEYNDLPKPARAREFWKSQLAYARDAKNMGVSDWLSSDFEGYVDGIIKELAPYTAYRVKFTPFKAQFKNALGLYGEKNAVGDHDGAKKVIADFVDRLNEQIVARGEQLGMAKEDCPLFSLEEFQNRGENKGQNTEAAKFYDERVRYTLDPVAAHNGLWATVNDTSAKPRYTHFYDPSTQNWVDLSDKASELAQQNSDGTNLVDVSDVIEMRNTKGSAWFIDYLQKQKKVLGATKKYRLFMKELYKELVSGEDVGQELSTDELKNWLQLAVESTQSQSIKNILSETLSKSNWTKTLVGQNLKEDDEVVAEPNIDDVPAMDLELGGSDASFDATVGDTVSNDEGTVNSEFDDTSVGDGADFGGMTIGDAGGFSGGDVGGSFDFDAGDGGETEGEVEYVPEPEYRIIDILVNEGDPTDMKVKIQNVDDEDDVQIKNLSEIDV